MKKFCMVLALLMLLVGCGKPVETPTEPSTVPPTTAAPTEAPTEAPMEAPTEAPTEPKETISLPAEPTDYDSFFSHTIPMDYDYLYSLKYRPGIRENQVVLLSNATDGMIKVLYDGPATSVTYDEGTAYVLSEDQKQIFAVNYEDLTPKTIYESTTEIPRRGMTCWANCLFFAAPTGEDTYGIYRIYLPENRVDLLTESQMPAPVGYRFRQLEAVSNQEVSWEFFLDIEYYTELLWDSPVFYNRDGSLSSPRDFAEVDTPEEFWRDKDRANYMWNHVASVLQCSGANGHVYHYYSPEQELLMYGSAVDNAAAPTANSFYPDYTPRPWSEYEKNDEYWWLDEYYQTNTPG